MIHDNLLYYLMEPSDATHGNMFEQQGGQCGTYFYNNLGYLSDRVRGTKTLHPGSSACSASRFNNISFFNSNLLWEVFLVSRPCNKLSYSREYGREWIDRQHVPRNNTLDFPCNFNQKNISLTQYFQNNHIVGYSPAALSSVAGPTIVDNGNQLYQTEAAANAQGYTTTNFDAPTTGGATIGAGANLTSLCTAIPESVAAAACLTGYVGVTYNQTNHAAVANMPSPVGPHGMQEHISSPPVLRQAGQIHRRVLWPPLNKHRVLYKARPVTSYSNAARRVLELAALLPTLKRPARPMRQAVLD